MQSPLSLCGDHSTNPESSETPSFYRYNQLAFSDAGDNDDDEGLIRAKARCPFHPRNNNGTLDKSTTLNVEIFGSASVRGDGEAEDDSNWPYLLYIHGVCESAETWTVQRLVQAAVHHQWRLAVLELEGHGLSSGPRAVCGSFQRLCGHVSDFIAHVMIAGKNAAVPFVIVGESLGGVLAAYAADRIQSQQFPNFLGAILISPAVGIDPQAIPPAPLVLALRAMAVIVPSKGFMTPTEDPSQYACPTTSRRNFAGCWPLATSRMLLDVTSKTVRNDQEEGRLVLNVPSLLVVAGEQDPIVPLTAARVFFEKAKAKDKDLLVVPKGDHGLMLIKETAMVTIEKMFQWMNDHVGKATPSS